MARNKYDHKKKEEEEEQKGGSFSVYIRQIDTRVPHFGDKRIVDIFCNAFRTRILQKDSVIV